MRKYEKEINYYKSKEKFLGSEDDFFLIVDNRFKKFDDDNDLSCSREFVKITNEMFFDFIYNGITDSASLSITLSDKKHSSNFLTYLLDFLTNNNSKLQKYINGILVSDYRLKLYEVTIITLEDTIIDESILETIRKLFPKLKYLDLRECKIDNSCNFNSLNYKILFTSCEIENINSFNYYTQPLNFHNCKINNINHSTIYAKIFSIDNTSDEMLERLYLTCHFPNLQELTIGNFKNHYIDKTSYKKSLLFLPKACPSLLKLQISGNIYSFDFLSMFNKLNNCEIRSNDDSVFTYELYSPYIENEEERCFIIKHSKMKIENEMDEHLVLLQKLNETVKVLSRLGMSDEEKNLYFNKKKPKYLLNPIDMVNFKEPQQYYVYDSTNDTLSLTTPELDSNKNYNYTYKMFNNILYRISDDKILGYLIIKKRIDLAEYFIYNPVGIPIVFRKLSWNINNTFEAAKETMNEELYKNLVFDENGITDVSETNLADNTKILEYKRKK